MQTISIDFSEKIKEIKAMHGVNNGPVHGPGMKTDKIEDFKEMGIPYSRLHDTQYPFGMGHFVDIHCIFKNFDNDPEDAASYDFDLTDLYISKIFEAGANVIYRLGESIEHLPKKYYVHPPKDYNKWAKICEHIIRHYTQGWANGFNYPIEYWEIWNEPDNYHLMWTGTEEEFFELYYVTSNHLKKCFPQLKIGGYASSGFYELSKKVKWEKTVHCMEFADKFFEYITREDKKCPLDFFSWHLYYEHPDEFVLQSSHVDYLLKKYGFNDTENLITEWNVSGGFLVNGVGSPLCGAIVSSVMCELQRKTSVKIANYYNTGAGTWNGLYRGDERLKGFYSLKFFNELYKLGEEVRIKGDEEVKNVFLCAATDGKEGGILIANIGEDKEVALSLTGFNEKGITLEFYVTDSDNDGNLTKLDTFYGDRASFILNLKSEQFVYIKARKAENAELEF